MRRMYSPRLTRRGVFSELALTIAAAGVIGLPISPETALAGAPSAEKIQALAFDGSNLLLSADGLLRSSDNGSSWTELSSELGSAVTDLATHPDRPGRILAALETGGVAVSEDGGATWVELGNELPREEATAIAVAADEPDTVFVSVAGDGVWQSKDAGETWAFVMDRPWLNEAEQDVLDLASVASPSGMGGIWIYAGTEAGLTRVPDCFCRWQDVQPGDAMDALVAGTAPPPATPLPPGEAVRSLALAPQVPEVLYAATASGIWKSDDAGVNWAQVHETPSLGLAVDPTDPDHIIAATEGGILSSRDGGLTWAAPEV